MIIEITLIGAGVVGGVLASTISHIGLAATFRAIKADLERIESLLHTGSTTTIVTKTVTVPPLLAPAAPLAVPAPTAVQVAPVAVTTTTTTGA